MKIAANINDEKLRKEQFKTLIEIVDTIKSKEDLEIFFESFLSESEKAYLGQRLNIMRMLVKNFSYLQIREKLNVSMNTITNAQKCLDKGGMELENIVSKYKFKRKTILAKDDNPFKRHYPGSIR